MQALQKKQAHSQQLRDVLAGASGSIVHRSIEERVADCKHQQYNEHQQLFAVLYSSIHKAACDNSIAGIKYFLALKQKPKVHIDDYDQHGVCPLHLAAERGCNDVVTFICENGCDVDIRTTYGNTAMMYACKDNKLDTIRLLFNLKAKLNLKNKAGQSALHYAAQGDNVEALQLMVDLTTEHYQQQKEAVLAVEESQEETDSFNGSYDDSARSYSGRIGASGGGGGFGGAARASIDTGADDDSVTVASNANSLMSADLELHNLLNITANNLMTPLHTACIFNSERVVDYLLLQGVRVNCTDSSGNTPLHLAGKKSLHKIYEQLLAAGAREDVKNQFGDTAADLLRDDAFY